MNPDIRSQDDRPGLLGEQDAQAIDHLLEHSGLSLTPPLPPEVPQTPETPEAPHTPAFTPSQPDPARLAQARALGALLTRWPVEPPPADLVQRTLKRVRQSASQSHQRTESLRLPFAPGRLTEVAAIVAIVLIAFSLAVPMLAHARDNERKVLCQSNLRLAGTAMNAYTQDFAGVMPRGRTSPNTPWWRVGQHTDQDLAVQSNSAHLYLLPRGGYIAPDALACPSNEHAPRGMTAQAHDWPTAQAVSYSYQNQHTSQPYRPTRTPRMAVLADKNPLFSIAERDGVTYRRDLSPLSASRFHRGRGQNVLDASGHVAWRTDPMQPRGQDNIWLINNVEQYAGHESPLTHDDSFLVP